MDPLLEKLHGPPDVHVEIGARIFPCHRSVLRLNSLYFKALFAHKFKDSLQATISLPIEHVSEESFSILLKFMYAEEYSLKDDLLSVFVTSSYLCCVDFTDKCATYIVENLKNIDLVPLMLLPQLKHYPLMHDTVLRYMCRHFSEVFLSRKATCRAVPYGLLKKLIRHTDTLIFSADYALTFCKSWLAECPDEHDHREKIMKFTLRFRLYRMSPILAVCERIMDETFSAEDMVELFLAFRSDEIARQPSYEYAKLYLCRNFSTIPKQKLITISFHVLKDLLRDPSLFGDLDACAKHVINFASDWLSYPHAYNTNRERFQTELSHFTKPFKNHVDKVKDRIERLCDDFRKYSRNLRLDLRALDNYYDSVLRIE